MNILTSTKDWVVLRKQFHNKAIGFIPTMGNIHAGHLSLCERSQKENDITVVSIFVNPSQFNRADDFKNYPRTLEEDKSHLNNIDYLFIPDYHDLYSDDYEIRVSETQLSAELEGKHRPEHFTGMLTIVLKLLNLIQPTRTYFGEKDYQQYLLVKKMVSALFLDTEIVACKTVREKDGLALSSRNTRLTQEQRKKSAIFPALLHSNLSISQIKNELEEHGFTVDYIAEKWGRRLGAVWLDKIRLIDNICLSEIIYETQ